MRSKHIKNLKSSLLLVFIFLMLTKDNAMALEFIDTENELEINTHRKYGKLISYELEEEKISPKEEILEDYNLSEEEFSVLCAIVMAEAKTNSYNDSYAVINTIYNRTKSIKWSSYVENGDNLYSQATFPGQFVVYENGSYLKYLGCEDGDSYQAIIDFLLTKDLAHEYLSFVSKDGDKYGKEQFVEDGNLYYNKMEEDDKVQVLKR